MNKITRLKFIGESKKFNSNQSYTLNQIAEKTNTPLYKVQSQLNGCTVFDANDIAETKKIKSIYKHYQCQAHETSAAWLKKALV